MRFRHLRLWGLLCILVIPPAFGQPTPDKPLAPVSKNWHIVNARIVQSPGRVVEKGSIVIENGIITQIGASVTAPYDAIILRGDSLTVYAGFIDGLSHTGVPRPKDDPLPRIPRPGEPDYYRAGIQPDFDVRSVLKADDASVAEWRKLGFTAAHVAPYGRMMPGKTALLFLSGKDANEMIFVPQVGLFGQLLGAARGQGQQVYPSNDLGTMAFWRQAFGAAKQSMAYEATYQKNPAGLQRPITDPVHTALFPLIKGEKPLFFFANEYIDALRGLRMGDDLGYKPILVGLKDGHEIIPQLKSRGTPVFLSLDLPEAPKEPKEQTKAASKNDRIDTPSQLPSELGRLYEVQKRSFQQYARQAATFAEAGIPFGFTGKDAKVANIKKNFAVLLQNGLNENQLLAALTTQPAKILGVEAQLGSIDKGKIANLVFSDGSVFEEKSHIRMVMVEGHLFKYPKPAPNKAAKTNDATNDLSVALGTWSISVETPGGTQQGSIQFSAAGRALSGLLKTGDETSELKDIELDGQTLTCKGFAQNSEIAFTLKFEGDTLSGSVYVTALQSDLPVTGSRTAKPN